MVAAAKSQETIEILWIWQIIFDTTTKEKLQFTLQDKKYLIINAADSPKQDLMQYVSQSNDFIHAARLRGGHVLVHWWVFQWSTLDLHTQRIPTLMFLPYPLLVPCCWSFSQSHIITLHWYNLREYNNTGPKEWVRVCNMCVTKR